jgi:hypothetical protein
MNISDLHRTGTTDSRNVEKNRLAEQNKEKKIVAPRRPHLKPFNLATEGNFKIHSTHSKRTIEVLPLSTRAKNVLRSVGFETLGDLNGLPFSKILEAKNCGYKTYEEVVKILEAFGTAEGVLNAEGLDHHVALSHRIISIPKEAAAWPLDLLPLSVRLLHALEKLNCRVIGDLNGLSYSVLTEMPDCGARTLKELREFVGKVNRGDFGAPREQTGKSKAAFLMSKMDEYVDSLSAHHREIFTDRLGAIVDPKTLICIGQKFQMTRERVRQIVKLLTDNATRFGGPPFVKVLQELNEELNQNAWPLTPELLRALYQDSEYKPSYTLSFYVRLFGWLCSGISAWPVGQTPAAYRTPNHEKVITQLKEWFKGKNQPLTTKDLHQSLVNLGIQWTSFEILEALRFAAEFEIDIADPKNPLISPPVEFPRRWARGVLASSNADALPTATYARAKALVNSRRSPGSRYRLANTRPI